MPTDTVNWVRVGDWEVSSVQEGPIAIGEAARRARLEGLELPTPELVDAIWQAADLRIEPLVRVYPGPGKLAGLSWADIISRRWHDGTAKTMAGPDVYHDQLQRIAAAVGGRPYTLLVGEFKDIVMLKNGKVGLYGWHRLDGTVIQPEYGGHRPEWEDYSQGWRRVRRVA